MYREVATTGENFAKITEKVSELVGDEEVMILLTSPKDRNDEKDVSVWFSSIVGLFSIFVSRHRYGRNYISTSSGIREP